MKKMIAKDKRKAICHLEYSEYWLSQARNYLLQAEELLAGHCDVAGIAAEIRAAHDTIQAQREKLRASMHATKQEELDL